MNRGQLVLATIAIVVSFLFGSSAAAEPHWHPQVFLRGEAKAIKDATPIIYRSYRPLHFYGNTVRRLYYRGRVLPTLYDLRQTARGLIGVPVGVRSNATQATW